MIRTFLAVDYEASFLDEVAQLAERLRSDPRLSAARWAPHDSLHTTLRFFGDSSDAHVATMRQLVQELATSPPISSADSVVRVPAVHGFPERQRAHVLVLDVEDAGAGPFLGLLAARAETAAVALGFAAESRPYHAHLTLARMRRAVDVSSLAEQAAALPSGRATAITLYASSSSPNGAVYTRIASAPLALSQPSPLS
jgi:2'-5' RNA ligase